MTVKIIPISDNRIKDLTGQRFGRLTVVGYVGRDKRRHSRWLCLCDCGKETVCRGTEMVEGKTVSCGSHPPNKTHGMSKTPEYRAWYAMIARCTDSENKSYKDYGGRGIKVCSRWAKSFEAFHKDMGPRPSARYSLDRIDNDKGYSPDNCRWALKKAQGNNRRTNNRLSFSGQNLTVMQWAERMGISPHTIYSRIRKGWTVDRALTEPVAPRKDRKHQ